MSSSETFLQAARPERPGEFTFTWSIHDYSFCILEENVFHLSPDFGNNFMGHQRWFLMLYPRGDSAPGFLTCYLGCLEKDKETCKFSLGIRMSNGEFKEGKIFGTEECPSGYSNFISFQELRGPAGYLANDTLTLRCRMWKTDGDIPTSMKCEAHSRMKVSKLKYNWTLNNILSTDNKLGNELNRSINVTELFNAGFQIKLEVEASDDTINFCIKVERPDKGYFWICVIQLLDGAGKVAHSTRGEHQFEITNEPLAWSFTLISKDKILQCKDRYLHNNQLTLRCELGFSDGYTLETFEYGNTHGVESITTDQQSHLQGVWIKNMQQCCVDGKFSDFTIRTNGRRFPISRAVLSAHSEVFDAMFDRDMKERKTGVVDIEDIDAETVSNMLNYVYTSTIDNIDCPSALKLYFAADKYGITALREKCSIYLKMCLDVWNVCDILELADRHEDHELKSQARDFVNVHAQEIISSDAWKKLMNTNMPLTCEVLQWMVCKKIS